MKARAAARCCQRYLSAASPKKAPAQASAKYSMPMEWTSQASYPGERQASGTILRAVYAAKAWPASCVITSTSPLVPLKFAKMNGAPRLGRLVQ